MTFTEQPIAVDLVLETGGGGAGRHVLDLHKELHRLGWNSTLLVSRLRADKGFLAELASLPPHQVVYLNLQRSPHPSDIPVILQLKERFSASSQRRILHAHSTKAAMLGWAVGDAVDGKVLTPHAYRGMDETLSKPSALIVRGIESIYSRAFGKVIAVSPDEANYIESLGVCPERICYIPNGVDTSDIHNRMSKASAAQNEQEAPVIGFVGRLVYQKNPELFIQVLKVLAERGMNVHALIVGTGNLRESLSKLAAQHNVDHMITWRGDVPAVEELGKMDVFLHTSHYESLPYALLEATAAEIPIVTTDNAGSRALFGGLLPSAIIRNADPNNLADAVMELLQDGPARRNHIEALRALAEQFTIQKMVNSTIDVYEELLSHSTRKRQP